MKKIIFLLCLFSCRVAYSQPVPFFIQLQQIDAPDLPAIHSYAKAQAGDKWLVVAGRVDGLHSLYPSFAFAPEQANNELFVIDTLTWNVWQSSLYNLPYSIRRSLSAVNTEYIQRDSLLYVVGGYGYDSLTDVKKTLSTLTALNVHGLINEITSGGNNLSPYIRQISDTNFTVAGGKLESIGSKFYLVGGQLFNGLYTKVDLDLFTQHYTNSISSFDLNDDGVNLSVSNFSWNIDTVNFHRRDLNTAPWISPSGEQGFAVYGGVFQYNHDLPYRNPIYATSNATNIDFSFEQKMSQYQCPVIPLYDSVTANMYSIFMGGISLYYFDSVNQVLKEDTFVPFIKDISALIHHSNGTTDEVILPVQLPERGEANAEFFRNEALPKYENGVFKLHAFSQPVLLGYIFGGITSNAGNEGYSQASNKVYRVILQPDFASSASAVAAENNFHIYPNPADGATQFIIANQTSQGEIKIVNALGDVVRKIIPTDFSGNEQLIRIVTADLPEGIYSVMITSNEGISSARLMIIH